VLLFVGSIHQLIILDTPTRQKLERFYRCDKDFCRDALIARMMNNNMMSLTHLRFFCGIILAINLVSVIQAIPDFLFKIPNGDKVVAPSGEAWPGLGHHRPGGGGALNVFGDDFRAAGYTWTLDLCQKDSDCDGLSNGQELGDPECIWQEGDIPQFDAGITHPGIADTERALETTTTSASGGSTCQDFDFAKLPSSYSNTSFLMPNYQVPTDHTTYVKYAFNLNFEGMDSYAVRFEPIIQNPEVVHHMILYQCDSEPTAFLQPNTRGEMACRDLVSAWAVGGEEQCLPEKVGIELDSSRSWYVIDMHYDNPRGLSGIMDNSGLQLTTFPKAAVAGGNYQSAGWMWAGANTQSYTIPPGRGSYEITAECSYPQLPSSGITIFSYVLHAHKIGRKIWTEVYRPASDSSRLLQEADCPEDCANRAAGMCSLCFAGSPGCCGSLDPNQCNGVACCSDCTVCSGCEGCYAQSATCNPNGNPGDNIFDSDAEGEVTVFDLGCDTRYDFDLQEVRNLPEYQTLYPSDTLKTHCVYDSTSRSSVTKGGDETNDEMCIGFFLYYPVHPDVKCMTTKVQVDAGDGQHVCQIKGQATVDDTLCSAPPVDILLAKVGFGALDAWLQIHIICMVLSMGLMIPVGVLIPMFYRDSLKNKDSWFQYHRILQSLGVLLMLIGGVAALVNTSIHLMEVHHQLGVAMFVLVLLQPLNAFIRPSKKEEEAKSSMKRTIWEVAHKGLGRIIVVASLVNIFLGVKLLKEWYSASSGLANGLIGFQTFVIVILVLAGAYKVFQKKMSSISDGKTNNAPEQASEPDATAPSRDSKGRSESAV